MLEVFLKLFVIILLWNWMDLNFICSNSLEVFFLFFWGWGGGSGWRRGLGTKYLGLGHCMPPWGCSLPHFQDLPPHLPTPHWDVHLCAPGSPGWEVSRLLPPLQHCSLVCCRLCFSSLARQPGASICTPGPRIVETAGLVSTFLFSLSVMLGRNR